MDEINHPEVTIKVIGHQWFWCYEYSDFLRSDIRKYFGESLPLPYDEYPSYSFTANMIAEEDLMRGQVRLLETD
jgi:cytochrome c oxidase subunit 2